MNRKISRIGLLGGSFDPVHNGHLELARSAKENFKLDKVIFVPARIPPHKKERRLTSHIHRLAMLRAAIKPFSGFYISRFEIERKTTTYTYRTVKYFKERFPRADIFFIMGSDSLSEIGTWKRSTELAGLCAFIVGKRAADLPSHSSGYRVEILKQPLPPVSSSEVRQRISMGKSIDGIVPREVERYIIKHELYKVSLSQGVRGDEDFYVKTSGFPTEAFGNDKRGHGFPTEAFGNDKRGHGFPTETFGNDKRGLGYIIKYLKKHLDSARFGHTLGVRRTALELADKFGVSTSKTELAALLHDVGRILDKKDMINYARKNKVNVPALDDIISHNPALLHGFISADMAKKKFCVNDSEVLSAIVMHTLGGSNMSKLAKIIYLADITSPDRRFKGLSRLRWLSKRDINKALRAAMAVKLAHVLSKNGWLHPEAVKAWNYMV